MLLRHNWPYVLFFFVYCCWLWVRALMIIYKYLCNIFSLRYSGKTTYGVCVVKILNLENKIPRQESLTSLCLYIFVGMRKRKQISLENIIVRKFLLETRHIISLQKMKLENNVVVNRYTTYEKGGRCDFY